MKTATDPRVAPGSSGLWVTIRSSLKAKRSEWTTDLLVIWLLVYTVYHSTFDFVSYNPELASWWVSSTGLSWMTALHQYLEPGIGFYRPTFTLIFKFLTVFVADLHNVVAWKQVAFAMMLVVSFLVYALVRTVWRGNRVAGVLAALFLAANPVSFIIVSELLIHDLIGAVFVVAAIIAFDLSLRSETVEVTRKLYGAAFVCTILAITTREMALAVPLMQIVLLGRYYISEYRDASRKRLLLWAAPIAALFIVYVVSRYVSVAALPQSNAYRTAPNLDYITINAKRMSLWMVRVFTIHLRDYIDMHDSRTNLALGLMSVAGAAVGWTMKILRDKDRAIASLVTLLCWIGVFLGFPVYAGYAPWHVFFAAIGSAAVFGLGVAELVRSIRVPRARYAVALMVVAVFVVVGTQDYTLQLTHPARRNFYQMNYSALQNPPIAKAGMAGTPLVFYEGGPNDWAFGAGNLFKFVYSNPGIDERRFDNASEIPVKTRLVWLAVEKAYFFRMTPDGNSYFRWYDDTIAFRRECLKEITQESDKLLAAGKYSEVAAMLKPLVERYRDSGVLQYQYASSVDRLVGRAAAMPFYNRAVAAMPEDFWSYFNAGRLRIGPVDWRIACPDLRRLSDAPVTYPGMSASIERNCY